MSRSCPYCAEGLPGPATPGERCPSCGERPVLAPESGPRPLPAAVVLTTILGVVYLALGGCCGLSTAMSAVDMAGMTGQGGRGLPLGPIVTMLAVMGFACVLHASAGLGLILRQEAGRIAGVVCGVVDLGLGLLMIAAGVAVLSTSQGAASRGVVSMFAVQAGMGAALTAASIGAIVLLRHRTTRAAFAAPDRGRAR